MLNKDKLMSLASGEDDSGRQAHLWMWADPKETVEVDTSLWSHFILAVTDTEETVLVFEKMPILEFFEQWLELRKKEIWCDEH